MTIADSRYMIENNGEVSAVIFREPVPFQGGFTQEIELRPDEGIVCARVELARSHVDEDGYAGMLFKRVHRTMGYEHFVGLMGWTILRNDEGEQIGFTL